ncbi:MAG: F0F1 ATP synthase subunit B [bacterium]|nr:F0F1 ATP synthase subunit B [bacterium]
MNDIIFLATTAAVENAPETSGVVGTLGLNWKLFLAQLVNFGIVLLVLWKWVFKPLVGALEGRRQKIEASIKQAGEIEKRLVEFEKHREQEIAKARVEAAEILKKASIGAEIAKQEIAAVAQTQAEKILSDAGKLIEAERIQMFRELREEVANLTVMATEKILREKLDEKKDKKIVEEIIQNMK